MKLVTRFFTIAACLLIITGSITVQHEPQAIARVKNYFAKEAQTFASGTTALKNAIAAINHQPATWANARAALIRCRLQYKHIAFFLDYFFRSESSEFDMPAKYEIEEPYMEYQTPVGMQVMEALLYEKNIPAQKEVLLQQAALIEQSAKDLPALLYEFHATDAQLLESLRLELVRIITLDITGYNAPLLKTGISEAHESLTGIAYALQPYLERAMGDSTAFYLATSLQYLQRDTGFNYFNRLVFLTAHALPLQRQLGKLITALDCNYHTAKALNYEATDLFSSDALNIAAFPGGADAGNIALAALGKRLFFEKKLSGNNQRSCASCHQPDRYFTDGLAKSRAFDEKHQVLRNAPSLLYSSYQYAQFWDGRAATLEKQIATVIASPAEMHSDTNAVLRALQQDTGYLPAFKKAFPASVTASADLSFQHIAAAIAAYLQTLHPFHSPFDRFMRGDTTALTRRQQQGFNLFMGKALCGTCHFAPLFNGLTPPYYDKTEFEVLGVPASANLLHPLADKDSGRYTAFPISFYLHAFKTPTVRNAAATAPYMHNGALPSLQTVMDFYNKGGGTGIGLRGDNQTLPGTPLQLTPCEQQDIIDFLHALTDEPG